MRINICREMIYENPKKYYIYELLRLDGRPFYIGKGSGSRLQYHEQEATKTRRSNLKLKIIRGFLHKFGYLSYRIVGFYQDEKYAHNVEKFLIKYYGRIDLRTGILTNLTDGGDPRNVSEQSKLLLSQSITKWIKDNPEEHKDNQKVATETHRKPENREQSRQIQLKYMEKHPEEFQETMNKTHETRRNPENRKANSERLQSYYSKPGSKEKSSQIALKWIKDNPVEHQEIIELSNKGKRTPEARAKNSKSRLEYIKEHPEKEQQRLEKMRKTSRTIESREINRRAANRKREVIIRIQSLIKTHNLTNITFPDGRSSIKKFQKLEEELLKTINTLPE